MTKKEETMFWKVLSRRQFLERSMVGGFAVGLGSVTKLSALAVFETPSAGDGVTLKVVGSAGRGFGVSVLYRGQILAQHNDGGEFSAVFQNGERSLEDHIGNWKPTSWSGDATHLALRGECKLNNLNSTVFVEVDYDVVNSHVVRKRIRFRQADMFMMFHQVSNRLEAAEPPSKFWSFDQLDCQGGPLREYFPAAGFRTRNNICVGLLTDAGYRNQWNRVVRRDGKPVKPASRRIPDTNLCFVARPEDRVKKQFFIQQTFGEELEQIDRDTSHDSIAPPSSSWVKQGDATLEERDGVAILSLHTSKDGLTIPLSGKSGEVYSVRLVYRAPLPLAAQIWDVDDQLRKLQNITLYDDVVPGSGASWSEFRTTVFVPALSGGGSALFLSLPQSEQAIEQEAPAGVTKVELRTVEVRREGVRYQPYHRLEMDRQVEKTAFVFVDETVPDTVRGYRMSSQIHLASGLGFEGGNTEKILYADLMMLCWNADTEDFRPILAPSIWYSAAGEMYLRDSFYALNGIHNRELNEGVFNLWAENQGTDGAINTLVEPNKANVERKSNDSTPLWLQWAFLNRRRFNTKLPMEKVRRAAEYCLRTYDPRRDGICWAQFVMGQLDVIDYSKGTSSICENQGMLAVTLRVIKELQIPDVSATISEDEIEKAEQAYRSYYDPARKFLQPAAGITDAIGFAEIFPEYLSLWLFNRKILTDEMVVNHLDRIPVMMPRPDSPYPETGGTVRPILIGLTDDGKTSSYFTEKWHPMVSDAFAVQYAHHGMDGIYYNGGSWMRIEICGYVAGMLHGWSEARKAIANRLWAETHVSPDFPTSHEYLATDPAHPFFGYHRVFAWNSFVLQALELAGLRTPDMDPDYRKK
jgi:hypothetical protein